MRWDVKESNVKVDITKDFIYIISVGEKHYSELSIIKKAAVYYKSNYIVPIFTGISWMNL